MDVVKLCLYKKNENEYFYFIKCNGKYVMDKSRKAIVKLDIDKGEYIYYNTKFSGIKTFIGLSDLVDYIIREDK